MSLVAVTVVLILGGATNAAAVTLERARWHGTFDVTQTYLKYTLNPELVGEKEKRVHIITSRCRGTKACGSVKFARVLGSGAKVSYTLRRSRPGTYKGSTFLEGSWWCTIDGEQVHTWTGRVDENTILKAKAQRNGKVTKYKGTLRLQYPPYEITEDVPQECRDYFAGQGMQEGDRPEIKLALLGVRR